MSTVNRCAGVPPDSEPVVCVASYSEPVCLQCTGVPLYSVPASRSVSLQRTGQCFTVSVSMIVCTGLNAGFVGQWAIAYSSSVIVLANKDICM